MRSLLERLRAARHIELGALIVALAVLALVLTGSGSSGRDDSATSAERRLCRLLEQIDGVGKVSVMISEDGGGAVIVASELDDLRTALEIQSAAKALLNIDLNRIRVIGKRGSYGGEGG